MGHLAEFEIQEFMMLSTCNRVEFFFRMPHEVNQAFLARFFSHFYRNLDSQDISAALENAQIYAGLDSIRHLFHVASSLDSLVVGEREIITQVRDAFERAQKNNMTGDFLRIAVQKAIETAKQVYTETEIATKPISVVNLGYRQLLARELNNNHRIAFIGAGQTIEALAGNLKSFDFQSTKVFNRTKEKAETLAASLQGTGFGLENLEEELGEFDILVTCTGSERPIIDVEKFKRISENSPGKKIILDLAIPYDIDPEVMSIFEVDYISIEGLKEEAKRNLKDREKEIFKCEALVENRLKGFEESFRTRKLELAMAEIPRVMKEIKAKAIDKKYAHQLSSMDEAQRNTVLSMLDYMEKKYVAVPMKLAKQIILDKDLKDSIID